jgi:hypothetical protein
MIAVDPPVRILIFSSCIRGAVHTCTNAVAERSFAWMARLRRLARDYERLPETVVGLHLVGFVIIMLRKAANLVLVHNTL